MLTSSLEWDMLSSYYNNISGILNIKIGKHFLIELSRYFNILVNVV